MLTPFDLIKGFLSFKSYFTWFLIATTIFGFFIFFKRKLSPNQHTTSWKGYLTYFLIIIGILSFIYLCFFHKTEPSSKYTDQLVNHIDKAIDKYENTINNYKELKSNWEEELKKCEEELTELYNAQEITQEQKERIHKALEENETKIQEIKDQLKNTTGNITTLKGQLLQLEQTKEDKEKEIKQKQEEEKLASPDDKIRLKAEIEKLQDEVIKIAGELDKINIQIGILESDQKLYKSRLKDFEELKKDLEKRFQTLSDDEKSIFNQIQTTEQLKAEIQKNIDEVDKEIIKIETRIKELEIMRTFAESSRAASDTWDKTHELSFGNIRDAIFQGAELVMDAYGGRGMLKAVSNGITKEAAGTIAKAGLVVHEVHRAIHLAKELYFNEDGTPKMMSKETYDSICARIDRDIAKENEDYKDAKKKLDGFKIEQKEDNLIKESVTSEKLIKNNKDEFKSWVGEYQTIINELEKKQKEVSGTGELYKTKDKLEEKLEIKIEEVNIFKEQLKQKNPSYARAQQRFEKQKREKNKSMWNKALENINKNNVK